MRSPFDRATRSVDFGVIYSLEFRTYALHSPYIVLVSPNRPYVARQTTFCRGLWSLNAQGSGTPSTSWGGFVYPTAIRGTSSLLT